MENEIKLQIRNMSKHYSNGEGVSHIDLRVRTAELITLLGPSGCGKSTILRTLGGFLSIDEGEILIDGEPVQGLPPEKRPTSMVFQSYNLWPHMTVYENLAFGLKIKKLQKDEIRERIGEMLELVRMTGYEKKYPGQLSGGQQQRIAIARSLLLRPSVLLLDEPFSALDAKIRGQMREELKSIQQKLKITVVFVTHDQEEAMAISDRIVVMNKGVFEQVGTPAEIYDNPVSRFVASFIGEMNFLPGPDSSVIAVRPEDVRLELGAPAADGQPCGRVNRIMLMGHYVQVGMELNGAAVRVYVPRKEAARIRMNDRIPLSFHKKFVYQEKTE